MTTRYRHRMRIRSASPSDLDAVQRIYAHHVVHGLGSFELEAPTLAEMRSRFDAVRERGLPYLVALEDRTVVGFAYAGPYRQRPAYRFTVEDSVYVSHEAQGRGVGAALLEHLVRRLGTAGVRQVVAVIGDSANQASIALHAKLGFREVGVLRAVGRKHERWVDTVLMQREIGGNEAGEESDSKPSR